MTLGQDCQGKNLASKCSAIGNLGRKKFVLIEMAYLLEQVDKEEKNFIKKLHGAVTKRVNVLLFMVCLVVFNVVVKLQGSFSILLQAWGDRGTL